MRSNTDKCTNVLFEPLFKEDIRTDVRNACLHGGPA